MHVRAAALFVVLFFVAALQGQTQPTSAPASPDVDHLIKQLGSDSAEDRDSAQNQLVDLGPPVVEALKKAASEDDDPEVRSRASAAITQMKDRDSNDASLITIHSKDGPANDVLADIAGQAHAQFLGYGPGVNPAAPNHTLTIEANRKPFWDVMTDACTQLNMCPVLDTPGRNAVRLYPAPRNWIAQSPHQIVGPYWIGVAGMNRMQNVDLMGPPMTDDQFLIKLIVFPEPKLAVMQMSGLNLKEAVDDAGNSLIPSRQQPVRLPHMMRGYRQMNHVIESRLAYPQNPGKKISIFRGEVVIQLAEDVQQFEEDDVMGTPRQTNPLQNCEIQASVVRQGNEVFRVNIQCTRQGQGDDQWNAMANRMNDLTLEDEEGHALSVLSVPIPGPSSETSFGFSTMFSRGSLPGLAGQHQANVKVGDPKKLIWKVATNVKSMTVPVMFRDLPMP